MGARAVLVAALVSAAAVAGSMYDVVDAVAAFLAPPECPTGCMNWTAALNASAQAAAFADPRILASLGARCAIPGRALHSLTQPVAPVMTPMEAAAFYGPFPLAAARRRPWPSSSTRARRRTLFRSRSTCRLPTRPPSWWAL